MKKRESVRIGNASGYWGDDPSALRRQVRGGPLDYITMDFLAEVTMSIMQKIRSKDPKAGYAVDFLGLLVEVLPEMLKNGTKLITNAGGANPVAMAEAIRAGSKKRGLDLKVVVVEGDDIGPRLSELEAAGCAFTNLESGASFDAVRSRVQSAHVYLGAAPVVAALEKGADIVITGRVTDTGLTLAPMIHELGWSWRDLDHLAAGIVAGHILECGTQATGGNFTDFRQVPSFESMGFPIVEMAADGSFVVTKHPGTGGLVSVDTVREQLVYEMGDPRTYITPEVIADFASLTLEDAGPDRVAVRGVKGRPPTDSYKVSMTHADGHRFVGDLVVSGPDAREKAERFAALLWGRVGTDFAETSTEYFGSDALHRSMAGGGPPPEIVLRVGARDPSPEKLGKLRKEIPGLGLSGPPGVCLFGELSRVTEIVSYWPALIDKRHVTPRVVWWEGDERRDQELPPEKSTRPVFQENGTGADFQRAVLVSAPVGTGGPEKGNRPIFQGAAPVPGDTATETTIGVPLIDLCLARSGDKGDTANIGVLARSPEAYQLLEKELTAQRVRDWFHELCLGPVERYTLPNLMGFNFLLHRALGGGGTRSLRTDAQGKTFAQALLTRRLPRR